MVVTGVLFIEMKNNEERLNEDEECQAWLLKQKSCDLCEGVCGIALSDCGARCASGSVRKWKKRDVVAMI